MSKAILFAGAKLCSTSTSLSTAHPPAAKLAEKRRGKVLLLRKREEPHFSVVLNSESICNQLSLSFVSKKFLGNNFIRVNLRDRRIAHSSLFHILSCCSISTTILADQNDLSGEERLSLGMQYRNSPYLHHRCYAWMDWHFYHFCHFTKRYMSRNPIFKRIGRHICSSKEPSPNRCEDSFHFSFHKKHEKTLNAVPPCFLHSVQHTKGTFLVGSFVLCIFPSPVILDNKAGEERKNISLPPCI